MTLDQFVIALIVALPAFLAALSTLIQSVRNGAKLDVTHETLGRVEVQTNGALTQLQSRNAALEALKITPAELQARQDALKGATDGK